MIRAAILFILLLAQSSAAIAQYTGTCTSPLAESYLDANNVRARIFNNGGLFHRESQVNGYLVPKADNKWAIFSASFIVAGLNESTLHAAAASYGRWEFWPGPIDDDGFPPSDCSLYDWLYSIRLSDIELYDRTGIAHADLADWPTGLGAPTLDAGGNPVDLLNLPLIERKDRKIDLLSGERPDMYGDQMIWWVMNDLGNEHQHTGSPPLGVEVHGLAFAASSYYPAVDNTTLFKYRIFNRSNTRYENVHIGFYYDIDLGDASDDFVGSDTTLSMGYQYNGDNSDGNPLGSAYGERPPAVGVLLIEGPHADVDGIDNDRDGQIDEDGERLRMTNYMHHYNGGGVNEDPQTGIDYYNYMRSRWKNGLPLQYGGTGFDVTGITSRYSFPGDPVEQTMWSETNADGQGKWNSPGRRKSILSSGPLTLEPGEETSVTIANVWARGDDHLDSVTELKHAAVGIRRAFPETRWQFPQPPEAIPLPTTPSSMGFDPIYPNPADEYGVLRYVVADPAEVTVELYDVLGRPIRTVLHAVKDPGWYTETIGVSDLPSGAYFYRISIGRLSATKPLTVVH